MSKYKYHKRGLEHRAIWEKAYGPIPPGFVIHHNDGNGKNNDLSNLQLMPAGEHVAMHVSARAAGTDVVDRSDPDVVESIRRHKEYRAKYPERVKAASRKYREEHPDIVRENSRRWKAEHPERVKEHKRASYQRHREEVCERQRIYQSEHREERNAYAREYRQTHKDECNERGKKWKENNHEKVLTSHRSYNDLHRDLIVAKAKLAGEKRKTLHYDPEAVKRAELAVQAAYQREIELGIRKA